ncbi:MAG: alpha/beta fold hydrolase, partial [Myxococcales bacterium]|nr:alpha/beta fold hydrolase [Myxococcales bacterium]
MPFETIQIATADGTAPACLYDRPGPGVLLLIDGIGMRPAMHEVGERLAAAGYRVLMPDVFYRLGAYTAPDATQLFTDPTVRQQWFARASASTNPAAIMRDVPAYLDALGGARAGVVGYCMGGRMALVTAATYPDRVAAVAAYHPGGLVTDGDDSPHRLVGAIRARVYVGAATDDGSFTDADRQRFGDALRDGGVDHTIEVYPARHGWVPSDTPAHDAAATARHW